MCFSPCCLPRRLCTSGVLEGKGVVWCEPARFATPSAAFGRRMSATSTTHEQPYFSDKRQSTCAVLGWYEAHDQFLQCAKHSCMCSVKLTWWHATADAATVYNRSVCHVAVALQTPAGSLSRASRKPADSIASSERHADAFARRYVQINTVAIGLGSAGCK